MTKRVATAPAKLVLTGDYAVLDGAPAVAMAIDRRAVAMLEASDVLRVRCDGPADSGDALFRHVVDALGADPGTVDCVLDTRAFADPSGKKLGIGSSAAITVALVRALAGDGADEDLFDAARRAHTRLQEGAGSGVDVATSWRGGLIAYRRSDAYPTALTWPAALRFAVLWSGTPASTRRKIERFETGGGSTGRARLTTAAEAACAAWTAGDEQQVVAAVRDYGLALRAMDVDHEIGIFDAGHAALAEDANALGLVYKPCGAGGGDAGIVIGTDDDAICEFLLRAESGGFRNLNAKLDTVGVSCRDPQ